MNWPTVVLPLFLYSPDKIIRTVAHYFDEGHDVVEGRIGGLYRTYFFRNPHHIRAIYSHPELGVKKPDFFLLWAKWLMGDGLFNDFGGVDWARKRKLMGGLFFNNTCSHAYLQFVIGAASDFIARLKDKRQYSISLHHEMERLVYDSSFRLIFGQSAGSDLEDIVRISAQAESLFSTMVPIWIPTRYSMKFKRDGRRLKEIFKEAIKKAKKNPIDGSVVAGLIASGITDQELLDEVFSVHFGVSAVATTMTWTLFQIASMPHIQNSVKVALEDSQHDYFQAVLDECMRIIPAFFGSIRYADNDIEIDGLKFKKKSTFMPLRYFAQKHEKFWKNPEEFDPSRFLGEHKKEIPAGAFIPFGSGPRKCLGVKLAPELVKYFTSALLREFYFETSKKVADFEFRYGVFPKTEIILTYQPNRSMYDQKFNRECSRPTQTQQS
ncbi:MAG: cytochrome P450 [Bacteriovoracia bacterium]